MSPCQRTFVFVFAGIAKTDSFGDISIELKQMVCTPAPFDVVSFVATVIDRKGEPDPNRPTPIITWYPLPGGRVRARSVDSSGNKIPDIEFGWQAVVEEQG